MKAIASPKHCAVKTKKGMTEQTRCVQGLKPRRNQAVFEVLTSFGDVGCIQNRRDHADSPGASSQHGIEIFQVDTADGEPRNLHIRGRPLDVVKRDGFGGWLGAGGVNRTDGDVIGTRGDGAFRLRRGVSAQTNSELRVPSPELRGVTAAGVEKVLLAPMTE